MEILRLHICLPWYLLKKWNYWELSSRIMFYVIGMVISHSTLGEGSDKVVKLLNLCLDETNWQARQGTGDWSWFWAGRYCVNGRIWCKSPINRLKDLIILYNKGWDSITIFVWIRREATNLGHTFLHPAVSQVHWKALTAVHWVVFYADTHWDCTCTWQSPEDSFPVFPFNSLESWREAPLSKRHFTT